MALVRYEPWSVVNRLPRVAPQALLGIPSAALRLQQSLDHLFNESFHSPEGGASSAPSVNWVPRVDIHEEKERFVVLADVPGVDPKDIDITADNGVLTVRGERRVEKRETENGYERVERASGAFLRRFKLPEGANTESISAKQTNGVLEVTIPKTPTAQPRKIAING